MEIFCSSIILTLKKLFAVEVADINKLKELDHYKQAAFAYLTCERLFPNYVYFSNNFNFGNLDVLRSAIDYFYLHLFDLKTDKAKINLILKEVAKNTPDTENFTTPFVSSALDACTAILDSLDFLISKNFNLIKNISTYAIDTVDMHIQNIENLDFNKEKDFQKKIDTHPLMKKENAIQSGIIQFLCKSKSLDYEDIKTLLQLQENNKKGNLDL